MLVCGLSGGKPSCRQFPAFVITERGPEFAAEVFRRQRDRGFVGRDVRIGQWLTECRQLDNEARRLRSRLLSRLNEAVERCTRGDEILARPIERVTCHDRSRGDQDGGDDK
jgi:hypothetical protein